MTEPGLSRTEKLSYGLGDLASNLSWNLISGFLLFFYVNVALIPVAMAGTLILVSMVLSACLDPVVGVIVDRTRSRFGKARPYLLYGSIPL
jgi:GPH family glycoside/pentoside/hexuronide:cation symporter